MKFTEPRGDVTLDVAALDMTVAIRVKDTGRGIPAHEIDRVFEPFVQVRDAPARHAEGAGLGLAISKQLAEAMGGRILLESEVGVGSTFTLLVPRGADR